MEMGDYIINILSSFVAIEYIDHIFEKKYHGIRRQIVLLAAWFLYFLLVTGLNRVMKFEGFLLLSYGIAVSVYGFWAVRSNFSWGGCCPGCFPGPGMGEEQKTGSWQELLSFCSFGCWEILL